MQVKIPPSKTPCKYTLASFNCLSLLSHCFIYLYCYHYLYLNKLGIFSISIASTSYLSFKENAIIQAS